MILVMRRFVALLLLLIVGATSVAYAGGNRLQRRASRFAEVESKKLLNEPESYEELDIKVDSAFVSYYNDPVILAEATHIAELERGSIILSPSLQKMVSKHKAAIKIRMAELKTGEFFGWEIRNRFRFNGENGRVDISEFVIFTDKSFKTNYYIAEVYGSDWDGYYDAVKCIESIVAEEELKSAIGQAYNKFSDAASVAFDKLCEGAEKAAEVVKKEGKVIIDEVKERGSEVAKDFSAGVNNLVESVSNNQKE